MPGQSRAQNIGLALQAFGAGMSGTMPQFQQVQNQKQQLAQQEQRYQDQQVRQQQQDVYAQEDRQRAEADRNQQQQERVAGYQSSLARQGLAFAKAGQWGEMAELIRAARPMLTDLGVDVEGLRVLDLLTRAAMAGSPEAQKQATETLETSVKGWDAMGFGSEEDREILQGRDGIQRYVDSGEPVFPDIVGIDPDGPSVRAEIRAAVTAVDKSADEIINAYNKVTSLEADMRGGNRSAINAGIMNVARLISPGVVTDNDARQMAGANTSAGMIYEFLTGKGFDKEDLLQIFDPQNPEVFSVDNLMSVARNITGSSLPTTLNSYKDLENRANNYDASESMISSYFNQDSRRMQSINTIMSDLGVDAIPPNPLDTPDEIWADMWKLMTPEEKAAFR
jgi:hypothetical protein